MTTDVENFSRRRFVASAGILTAAAWLLHAIFSPRGKTLSLRRANARKQPTSPFKPYAEM